MVRESSVHQSPWEWQGVTSPQAVWAELLLFHPRQTCAVSILDFHHFSGCAVVPHFLICISPMTCDVSSFSVLICSHISSSGRRLLRSLAHSLIRLFCCWAWRRAVLYRVHFCTYFLLVCDFSSRSLDSIVPRAEVSNEVQLLSSGLPGLWPWRSI